MSVRVLMLSPVYPHASSPAEGVFIQQQVSALTELGVYCTVLVGKPWLPEVVARRWQKYKHVSGLPRILREKLFSVHFVRHVQFPNYRVLNITAASFARAVLQTLNETRAPRGFDLIHAHTTHMIGMAAPLIADALHLPFVVTLHIQDDPRVYRGAGKKLYDRMFNEAAALVAVGTPLERFGQSVKPKNCVMPIQIIPNGVELPSLDTPTPPRLPSGITRIVSVGNLWQIKGIDYTLRALAQLKARGFANWFYVVVGDGPERAPLENLVYELELTERVQFRGSLPHAQALAEIAAADLFVLPSWQESFGVVYLEAMAHGIPAIGCRGQGAEDIIVHQETGLLVDPQNVSSLADAFAQLLQNPQGAQAMGLKGRQRAQEFSWQKNAQRYSKLYAQILETRAAR